MTNYTTTDLYLAATLRTLTLLNDRDVAFVGIFGSNMKKEFHFNINEGALDEIINAYYSRNLPIDAKTLVESIKELKERVSGGR